MTMHFNRACMARVIQVQKPEDFDAILKEQLAEKNPEIPLFVYLFGTHGTDGKSWCPDCVEADPIIRNGLKKLTNYILLECPVGERSEYGPPYIHLYPVMSTLLHFFYYSGN
jgi:hypothetical protein